VGPGPPIPAPLAPATGVRLLQYRVRHCLCQAIVTSSSGHLDSLHSFDNVISYSYSRKPASAERTVVTGPMRACLPILTPPSYSSSIHQRLMRGRLATSPERYKFKSNDGRPSQTRVRTAPCKLIESESLATHIPGLGISSSSPTSGPRTCWSFDRQCRRSPGTDRLQGNKQSSAPET